MIYLILDTNTWIYLANGNDPLTAKSEDLHFTLFDKLSQKMKDGSVKVLINEIVLKEWQSNKEHTLELIKKLKGRLKTHLDVLAKINEALDSTEQENIKKIKEAYVKAIESSIQRNELHIHNVEKLLQESLKIDVNKDVKAFVTDWAIEKNAPFKGDKKNSTADALILFSCIEFVGSEIDKNNGEISSFFVSGNRGDFSDEVNHDKIHSDLAPKLDEVNMLYFRSLPKALNSVEKKLFQEEEIKRIEEEMELLYEANLGFCDVCSPDEEHESLNIIHFNGLEEISSELEFDPNQMEMDFDNDGNFKTREIEPETFFIEIGNCMYCGTEHIRCDKCKHTTPLDEENRNGFECEGCGIYYKIIHEYVGSGMFEDHIVAIKNQTF